MGPQTMFRGQVNRAPHPWCHSPTKFMSWAKSNWAIKKSPQTLPRPTAFTSSSINQPPMASRGGSGGDEEGGSGGDDDQVVLSFYTAHPCNFVEVIVVNLCLFCCYRMDNSCCSLSTWCATVRFVGNADFSFRMPYLIVDLCIVCCSWSKFLYLLNCLGVDQVWICKELLIFSCRNNFGDIVSGKVQSDVPSIYSKVVDRS